MAGKDAQPRSLKTLGTFQLPTVPPLDTRVPYGPALPSPPAPLAFLAPWLEGAVDLARGALWGSEGAADTAAAKGAELVAAGLPLVGGLTSLKGLGFFSRVDKALDLIPAKGAHPNKVASLLKSNASAEELAYRNVPEFLAGKGNATVTRAELAEHLAAHPAPVPSVKVRGGSTDPAHVYAARDLLEHGATPEEAMTALQKSYKTATAGELSDALYAARNPKYPVGPTKFGNYTVPGGEAYRETLVTLPPPPKPNQAALEAQVQATQARLQELYQQAEGLSRRGPDALKPVWAEIEDLQTHHRNLMREMSADPPGQFRSGHFDEPNILVHTRANERTLPTGERGRFVEEVQSDWHQKGKKEGYASPTPETGPAPVAHTDIRLEEGTHSWMAFTPDGRKVEIGKGTVDDAADARSYAKIYFNNRAAEQAEALRVRQSNQVPDAPFKETWPDLGLKQQVLETAADPNAEWIGFTGGATQAARYDLSKQISKLEYQKLNTGGNRLIAFDLNGDRVIDEMVAPDKLGDYVGKDVAAKLLASDFIPDPRVAPGRVPRPTQALEGLDLQVGGEGMRHFYDQVLPKRLEKIVKPFGGTVERGALGKTKAQIDAEIDALMGSGSPWTNNMRDAYERLQAERNAAPTDAALWFARLTPEMKARILKEGLPLLSLLPLGVLGNYGQPPAQEPPR